MATPCTRCHILELPIAQVAIKRVGSSDGAEKEIAFAIAIKSRQASPEPFMFDFEGWKLLKGKE